MSLELASKHRARAEQFQRKHRTELLTLVFTDLVDSVKFALLVQRQTRALARERDVPLAVRMGIHVGEVVIEEHERGPKPKDLYGSQIDLCARVMGLAESGQVLLTRAVFDSARQAIKGEDIEGGKVSGPIITYFSLPLRSRYSRLFR